MQEDDFHDAEMDEESDREENVERQFNFAGEISMLVDYKVISHYVSVINKTHVLSKNGEILQMTASFFRRVLFQLKQTWIFFQLEYMHTFNLFLHENHSNNSLMRGLMDYQDTSLLDKKLKLSKDQLRQVITTIVGRFVQLQKQNPLLLIEALFRFQSRDIKESIVSNYGLDFRNDNLNGAQKKVEQQEENVDDNIVFEDEQPIYDGFDEKDLETNQIEVDEKKQWTQ